MASPIKVSIEYKNGAALQGDTVLGYRNKASILGSCVDKPEIVMITAKI